MKYLLLILMILGCNKTTDSSNYHKYSYYDLKANYKVINEFDVEIYEIRFYEKEYHYLSGMILEQGQYITKRDTLIFYDLKINGEFNSDKKCHIKFFSKEFFECDYGDYLLRFERESL